MRIEFASTTADYVGVWKACLRNTPPDQAEGGVAPAAVLSDWAALLRWPAVILPVVAICLICTGSAGLAGWYPLPTNVGVAMLLIGAAVFYAIWYTIRTRMWIARFIETGEWDWRLEAELARRFDCRLGQVIIEIDSRACRVVTGSVRLTLEWTNVRDVRLEPTHFIIRGKAWPKTEFIGIPLRVLPVGTDHAALLAVFQSLKRGEPVAGFA